MNRRTFTSLASGLALLALVMTGIAVFRSRANPGAVPSSQPQQQSTAPVLIELAATPTAMPNCCGNVPTPFPPPLPACPIEPIFVIYLPQSNNVLGWQQLGYIAGCVKDDAITRVDVQIDGQYYATLPPPNPSLGEYEFRIGRAFSVPWTPTLQLVAFAADGTVLKTTELISVVVQELPSPYGSPIIQPVPPAPLVMPTADANCVVTPTYTVFSPTTQLVAAGTPFVFGVSTRYNATCDTRAHVVAFRLNPNESAPTCDAMAVIPDNRPFWADMQPFMQGQQDFSRQFNTTGPLGVDHLLVRLQILDQGSDRLLFCAQEVYREGS
jgi:hypothetical protein